VDSFQDGLSATVILSQLTDTLFTVINRINFVTEHPQIVSLSKDLLRWHRNPFDAESRAASVV
jgi:hypothetical protein